MSIDLKPAALMEQIKSAENFRDESLRCFDDMVSAYHGSAYHGGRADDSVGNHYFEFLSLKVPRVAFNNPRVRVDSSKTGERGMRARATQHALNRWNKDTNFKRLAEKLAVDYFFAWGATVTTLRPRPGFDEPEDPIYWPQVLRLDQKLFGFDSQARSFEEARFVFHVNVMDHEDLMDLARADAEAPENEREGWNIEAVKKMHSSGVADLVPNHGATGTREKVAWYEVWIPGLCVDPKNTPERGYHGIVVSLAMDAGAQEYDYICEPRDFYGPRWGPYTLYGCYTVPNKPWPLSALTATKAAADELRLHAGTVSAAAANYKRVILMKESQRGLANKIKSGKHDYVYTIKGFDKDSIVPVEIGGPTEEMLLVEQRAQANLDRKTGVLESQRGEVSGDATATENAIANVASMTRDDWQAHKFWAACERNLATVAWYLRVEDRVVMELEPEAQKDFGGTAPPLYHGGKVTAENWPGLRRRLVKLDPRLNRSLPPDNQPPLDDPDLSKSMDDDEISIEIGSMARKDEKQRQVEALDRLSVFTQVGQMMLTMPNANWAAVLEDIAKSWNWPEFPYLFNVERGEELAMANAMAALEGGGSGGGKAAEASHNVKQPTLGRTQARQMPDSRSKMAALPGNKSGQKAGAHAK